MTEMNRRAFLSAAASAAWAVAHNEGARAAEPDRPMNVLFIGVDDLRPELGCYGHPMVKSPNIDRLARGGLIFDRAYCQQAICSPSRISLLSGLRPDSTGIYDLVKKLKDERPGHVTLPQLFRRNGYETISIGKIYHHPDDDPEGWSKAPYRAEGKWEGRGYLSEDSIQKMRDHEAQHPGQADRGPAYEAADVPDGAYPDGVDTDLAIQELRRLKDKPFFLAMGFHKPHLPFNAPKRYWDLYDPEDIQLAENPFPPKDATEYSLTNFGELRNYHGVPQGEAPLPNDLARILIHGYYACVSYVDALIGRLLDELDALNLRDNTIVILWGDHGWKLGEHGSWCKHTNFENDTHVPLLISVPHMKATGKRSSALVEYVDMYPTLAELCGLQIPEGLEGCSFAPLLDKPKRPWKSAAFSQYPRDRDKPDKVVMGYSVRTERYHYIEWKHVQSGEVRARELYDHKKDPAENVNVVGDPKYDETVRQMADKLHAGWRAALPPASGDRH